MDTGGDLSERLEWIAHVELAEEVRLPEIGVYFLHSKDQFTNQAESAGGFASFS